MLNPNFLQEKLQKKISVIGTWVTIPSLVAVEALGYAGLDFLVIDREHGSFSWETVSSMIVAAENLGISPLVRVADNSLSEIQKALDFGAHGIHIPNVESLEDIEKVIYFSKYPPLGNRGFSPFTRAGKYNGENARQLVERANHKTLIAIHVEGKKAFDSLDQFLQSPCIDILFIGPYDLSKSMGLSGDIADPLVQNYLKEGLKRIRSSGKVAGTIANDLSNLSVLRDQGANYITYSVDSSILRFAYEKVCGDFRKNLTNMALIKEKN